MNAITPTRIDISKQSRRGANKGHWGTSGKPNMIEWSHPDLGSVQVELQSFLFSKTVNQQGHNTWCRIELGHHKPSHIVLDFNYSLNEGVEMIHARGKRVINTANEDPDPFAIRIEWKPGAKKDSDEVPHLPDGYMQDFQLYLVNKTTGFLVYLEVAVVSRGGVFWVTMHEVLGAQAVWHPITAEADGIEGYTSIKIGNRGYTLVPVYNENCYPGFDPVASWNRSYQNRADKVLGYVAEFDGAITIDDCTPGQWDPQWPAEVPAELAKKGYQKVVVMWFSLTLGWGFLLLENGQPCYVHFKSIQDESGNFVAQAGDFPVIEPMKGYYVKTKLEAGAENPKATVVRPAELAEAA